MDAALANLTSVGKDWNEMDSFAIRNAGLVLSEMDLSAGERVRQGSRILEPSAKNHSPMAAGLVTLSGDWQIAKKIMAREIARSQAQFTTPNVNRGFTRSVVVYAARTVRRDGQILGLDAQNPIMDAARANRLQWAYAPPVWKKTRQERFAIPIARMISQESGRFAGKTVLHSNPGIAAQDARPTRKNVQLPFSVWCRRQLSLR
ncbi:MAG: hypothetical protein JST85_15405 [Acidobacteria bacterium]|nr:hypothetical protein [Acidobacteriota bacterium]